MERPFGPFTLEQEEAMQLEASPHGGRQSLSDIMTNLSLSCYLLFLMLCFFYYISAFAENPHLPPHISWTNYGLYK